MRKALSIVAITTMLLVACNSSKKDAAKALENAEIQKIDSVVTQMDSLKSDIDSSVKEVDDLVDDL